MSGLPPEEAVRRAIERTLAHGAHSADALHVESDAVEARVRGEQIDFVTQARERALGIRAFVRGASGLRSALTSTSDLAADAVDRLAEDTVALARATAEDACAGLPEEGFAEHWPDLALLDPDDRRVTVEARIAGAREAEAAARAVDPRIANSEGSEVGSTFLRVRYASSAGFDGGYEAASHFLSSAPVASENGAMQYDHWVTAARRMGDLEDPARVGRRAAERAVGLLGARRVATCEVPVVFDATTARSLLGNLASCLSGYAIYRGSSFLARRLGEPVASPLVTVVDDGHRPGGLGSKPFDGEGQSTGRRTVVDRGRLEGWMLDCYSARKLGLSTTGNASRGPGSAPGVAPTNLWIEPGDASEAELVADTPRGLLVTGLFGHGFNPVTGDFSRGARGFWIENGRAVHPVDEITVAGNLGDMLAAVDGVAREIHWFGRVAAPALRVARMTVAGS